jgi:hypothetical protein
LGSRRRDARNRGCKPGQLARLRYASAGAPVGSDVKKDSSRLRQKVQSAAVRAGHVSAASRRLPHPVCSGASCILNQTYFEPGFHFIGARVETRRLSSYG